MNETGQSTGGLTDYVTSLGASVESQTENEIRLRLPFKDENSNPGKVLHGGVAASMIAIAGLDLARGALGEAAAPFHTAGIQVSYLAAAIGEEIIARGRVLRKGRELCFAQVEIDTADGKPIASGLATIRGRFGAAESPAALSSGDDGTSDPGLMGKNLPIRVPFIGGLGLVVENMQASCSRIRMPLIEKNRDTDGSIHEGAILALLDTTGAMAAWAHTGPGAYKASTVGVQADIRARSAGGDLIAYGRMTGRDREIFWSAVEVAEVSTRRIIAAGTVLYRIVIPEQPAPPDR